MLIAKCAVFPSTSIPKAIHTKRYFANMIFATMKQSALLSSSIGRVSSKDGTNGNGNISSFLTETKHIKSTVVGSLENELIFSKNFCIIYLQEIKKKSSPLSLKFLSSRVGWHHSCQPTFSAGVVHRLVRRPSKPDRRVQFPLPAPSLTNPDC